jgi:hypothetical protein
VQLSFDPDDLRPLVQIVVAELLAELGPRLSKISDRFAFTQPEAAALLGVTPATLRDARLRGEIIGSKVGKKIVYSREELAAFLTRQRVR